MQKLTAVKSFIAKNRAVIAVGIVATATVAAVVIDVVMRDEDSALEALKEAAE